MKKLMTILFAFVIVISVQAQEKENFLDKVKSGLDPASIVGLNQYDEAVIFKALKIKKKSTKAEVRILLNEYNNSMEGLRTGNMGSLVGFGMELKDIITDKNWKEIWTARTDYKENIQDVRKQVSISQNKLEVQLLDTLKKRKEKKWFKYTESLREEQENRFSVGDMFAFLGM